MLIYSCTVDIIQAGTRVFWLEGAAEHSNVEAKSYISWTACHYKLLKAEHPAFGQRKRIATKTRYVLNFSYIS